MQNELTANPLSQNFENCHKKTNRDLLSTMRHHRAALLLTTSFVATKPSISFTLNVPLSLVPSAGRKSLDISYRFVSSTTQSPNLSKLNPYRYSYNLETSRKMSTSNAEEIPKQGGQVSLLQFKVSSSKDENQEKVKQLIDSTMEDHPNTKMIVLPEIWNGPYATAAFSEYSEILPSIGYKHSIKNSNSNVKNDLEEKCSSANILFEAAIKHGIYIVGGSISEKDNDKIYNTCLCISPDGSLVAKHRKVHLFDIDVKGGITFRESDTLTGGDTLSVFDTGDDLFGYVGVGIW